MGPPCGAAGIESTGSDRMDSVSYREGRQRVPGASVYWETSDRIQPGDGQRTGDGNKADHFS